MVTFGGRPRKEQNIVCNLLGISPRRLIIVECRRFGTLYLFHLQRMDMKCEVWRLLHIQPLKMEQIGCSETSAFKTRRKFEIKEQNVFTFSKLFAA